MPPTLPGDTPAADRLPVGPRTWWPVAAVLLAVAWGGNEFTPLLVMYREQGHIGDVMVDVLLAAYVFGIVPALLLGGPLSDRHGRRPLLLPAAPIGALGSLVLALDPTSPLVLALGRVLCGVALGLAMAVGSTWITELSARTGNRAAGPRRGSLSLTTGFLAGAGAAALGLVSGLTEVARIAGPGQLAGLTAVFYSLTYLGFFVPMALSWLRATWSYPQMFGFGAVLRCCAWRSLRSRPARHSRWQAAAAGAAGPG